KHFEEKIIDLYDEKQDLKGIILEETNNMGINNVLDICNHNDNDSNGKLVDNIIASLSSRGTWVTNSTNIQLNPIHSKKLNLKSASLSFINEQTWVLSSLEQGRYLRSFNIHQKLMKLMKFN